MPISTRRTGRPDGIYGMEVLTAVRSFQTRHGLSVDGIAGRRTLAILDGLFQTPTPASPPASSTPAPQPIGHAPSPVLFTLLSGGRSYMKSMLLPPSPTADLSNVISGNWLLLLQVTLALHQMGPGDTNGTNKVQDADGVEFTALSWPGGLQGGLWTSFVQDFRSRAQRFWNRRFWLEAVGITPVSIGLASCPLIVHGPFVESISR